MLRHQVQNLIAQTLGRALTAGSGHGPARHVVLCYHSVHPAKSYSVKPEEFDRQLTWLCDNCRVVPFTAIQANNGGDPARPVVSITFDDGYLDNYEHAFPILSRHRLPATFFITSGFTARDPEVLEIFGRIREGEEAEPMSAAQMREMSRHGMEFGGHTRTHPNLARLSYAQALDEMSHSRVYLEQELGRPVTAFAYPFGIPRRHFTDETIRAASQAGFATAAAVRYSAVTAQDSPMAIPRFSILDEDIATFAAKVRGWWDYLGYWQAGAPAWAGRLLAARQLRG